MSPKEQKNTLFVRHLSPATQKSDLDSHFGGLGPLRHAIVVTEPGTEKCKGIGFVTFAFEEDAQRALKTLNGSCIRGRKISLDVARKRERRGENDIETSDSREKRSKTPVKREGAKKGSVAMRTVLLTTAEKDGQLTEDEAKEAVHAGRADAGFEECIMSANSNVARCVFSSWALAGKAAAWAHGPKYYAVIEALQGGKRTTLIVRNLPFLIDENELKSRFQSIAPLRNLRLAPSRVLRTANGKNGSAAKSTVTDKHLGSEDDGIETKANSSSELTKTRCGGYAFVEYFLVADAKYAITKLNGIKLGGRVIAVDLAVGKNAYEAQEKDDESEEESDAKDDEGKAEGTDVDEDAQEHEGQDGKTTMASSRKVTEEVFEDSVGKPNKRATSTDEELSRTVFVRNLLFETSAPELWKAMEDEFGKVEQAVLVTHPVTRRPRGTAFVRFALVSSATQAMERAGQGIRPKEDFETEEAMESDGKQIGFKLHGRELLISSAVDKSKARNFESSIKKRKDDDPRNIRLAWVGMIKPDSDEGKALSKEDLARRAKAMKEKRVKLERNPNVYVSEVRLCVRNLPKDCDEKFLKHMFLSAAQESEKPTSSTQKQLKTKQGDSSPQEKQDKGDGKAHQARIVHAAIVRDPERKERSKGYGFVQYEDHEDALRALTFINNNPKVMEWLIEKKPKALRIDVHRERLLRKQWGDGRRLMVEFALEDTRKVRIIEKIKEKGRAIAEEHKRKRSGETELESSGKRKKQKKENLNVSNQNLSKSERRAALKRERASLASKKQHEKSIKGTVTQSKKSESPGDEIPLPRQANPQRKQTRVQQSVREAEQPDPKPKKPKKKRKAADIEEENKFDRILLSYKQKLAKSGTSVAHPAQNEVENPAGSRPRWFE